MTNFIPPQGFGCGPANPCVPYGFVPPPAPPPPPRHPDLWGDYDCYSRKEVDELVAAAVAEAKRYTDEKIQK